MSLKQHPSARKSWGNALSFYSDLTPAMWQRHVHQSSNNIVLGAGNIWINGRSCYVHMGLCEGDGYDLCRLQLCITGALKERRVPFPLTASNNLLTWVAAVATSLLLLLLLHGTANTELVQHLSCMQLSWDGKMQQSWVNFTLAHTHTLPHCHTQSVWHGTLSAWPKLFSPL